MRWARSRHATSGFALVITAIMAAPSGADTSYSSTARIAHIAAALDAVRTIDTKKLGTLRSELQMGGRTTCKSGVATPQVTCMIKMARATCATRPKAEQARCTVLADMIVTNAMGEKQMISSKRRLQLMGESADFRAAVDRELLDRYAILVARLTLTKSFDGGAGLPRSVDSFCIEHVRSRRITWARCVSAIVWYVGTAHKAP